VLKPLSNSLIRSNSDGAIAVYNTSDCSVEDLPDKFAAGISSFGISCPLYSLTRFSMNTSKYPLMMAGVIEIRADIILRQIFSFLYFLQKWNKFVVRTLGSADDLAKKRQNSLLQKGQFRLVLTSGTQSITTYATGTVSKVRQTGKPR